MNRPSAQRSIFVASLACEIELFKFNDPPIAAMWFSGALIKLVIIPWKSSTKWESRLIRKPTKLLHSVERSGSDLIADRMCPQKYFLSERSSSRRSRKMVAVLDPFECDYFWLFLFFLVSLFGAVLSPYHECVQFFSCQHSRMWFLFQYFYDFFFVRWCFIEAKIMTSLCSCVC